MQTDMFDVAVIGGGPAGMMAAGRAAELGARVVLLEKNPILGKKLLITGGGRCNILHAEFDTHRLVEKYGKKGKALYSTFARFDALATREFFESRGVPIKIEAEQRAFPVSDKAEDVQRTMIRYMEEGGVEVRTGTTVRSLEASGDMMTKVVLARGAVVAERYVLATGGKSHPETGSTGDGFVWMRQLGHTVIQPDPALVPVQLRDPWVSELAGISLQGVRLTAVQHGEKKLTKTGKMLFTHIGLSGPLVLNMSKAIGELLHEAGVTLLLDLFPTKDLGTLSQELLATFEASKNRQIHNVIGSIVPAKLGHTVLRFAGIPEHTPLHQLTREQRLALASLLKAIPMTVQGLLGPDKAIVTGGGVDLREVDFASMGSKRFANLYLAGDILDFDRPSGGFSLQICWSTGYVAGSSAVGDGRPELR